MRKVTKFLLKSFESTDVNREKSVTIPEESIFLKVVVLHDGLYCWYEIPVVDSKPDRIDTFYILGKDVTVPEDAEYIDVLSTLAETPEGQAMLVFPIYRKNS